MAEDLVFVGGVSGSVGGGYARFCMVVVIERFGAGRLDDFVGTVGAGYAVGFVRVGVSDVEDDGRSVYFPLVRGVLVDCLVFVCSDRG